MFFVCVSRRDVDVSNLWLLPCAPCWRWSRVSLETETEAQRERWEVRQGMASLSHPSTSAFSHSASYAVPLGSPSSTNVHSCVHRRLGAFAEEHQNQVLLHQKQVLISWLFLKLLIVFPAFTHRAEMWVRIILTFIYSTLLLSGNFGQVSCVFIEIWMWLLNADALSLICALMLPECPWCTGYL